jgi:hypothetical protein
MNPYMFLELSPKVEDALDSLKLIDPDAFHEVVTKLQANQNTIIELRTASIEHRYLLKHQREELMTQLAKAQAAEERPQRHWISGSSIAPPWEVR